MPVEAQIAALNTCGIVASQKPMSIVGVELTKARDYMRLASHDIITITAHQRFQPVASSKDVLPAETLAAEQTFNELEIVGHFHGVWM